MEHKIVAIPIDKDHILDPHFGHCKLIKLYRLEDNNITSEEVVTPPPHEPGVLPAWLARKAVSDLITGGIGEKAIAILNQYQISTIIGAQKISSQELIKQFINGSLYTEKNQCHH